MRHADPYEFGSARRRLERASEHLQMIDADIAAFESQLHNLPPSEWQDLYPPVEPPSFRSTRSGHELRDVRLQPQVSVRVGEFLYNVRAALDHTVYSLAWHDTGEEPVGGHARALQFPIEDTKADFDRTRPKRLKGLDDHHVEWIERRQPFRGAHWTRDLRALSNRDKHRQLLVISGGLDLYDLDEDRLRVEVRERDAEVVDIRMAARLYAILEDEGPLLPILRSILDGARGFVHAVGRERKLYPLAG